MIEGGDPCPSSIDFPKSSSEYLAKPSTLENLRILVRGSP